jgi:DNA-binding MarR family transcriptional regulator
MTPTSKQPSAATPVASEEVDAVLVGTEVIASMIAESTAGVEHHVTISQLRVLVMTGSLGPLNLAAVAKDLGVHPSNATRTCDRLVEAGLLDRRTAEHDRRQVALTLTASGRRLVTKVMAHRRRLVEQLLGQLPAQERAGVAGAFQALNLVVRTDVNDDSGAR